VRDIWPFNRSYEDEADLHHLEFMVGENSDVHGYGRYDVSFLKYCLSEHIKVFQGWQGWVLFRLGFLGFWVQPNFSPDHQFGFFLGEITQMVPMMKY
jgi:hypothetical protein